jgi:ParB family chromosome partitioning protein
MPDKKHGGLGRGLDYLFPEAEEVSVTEENKAVSAKEKASEAADQGKKEKQTGSGEDVLRVRISAVEPNRDQPRKNFDEAALNELADSIRQHGLIQPILVCPKKDRYEIVAGERRWRAAKLAGLKEIPVIVRKYSEQEIAEISLIENLQREDLDPIEEAHAYESLIEKYELKQEELAQKVSRSRTAITNSMRLLKLDKRVQDMVSEGSLSAGHARALIAVEDPEEQCTLAEVAVRNSMSVREVENKVRSLSRKPRVKQARDAQMDAILRDIEEKIKIR